MPKLKNMIAKVFSVDEKKCKKGNAKKKVCRKAVVKSFQGDGCRQEKKKAPGSSKKPQKCAKGEDTQKRRMGTNGKSRKKTGLPSARPVTQTTMTFDSESLFTRHKDQNPKTAFAFFPPVDGDWDGRFRELAAMSRRGEVWESKSFKPGNLVILRNYLNYTFLRLQEEKKVLYSKNLDRACFNTGLQTQYGKDILASFRKNSLADSQPAQPWVLYRFWDVDSADLRDFAKQPQPAEYYKKASELFFDLDYDLKWKTEHIVEDNAARLPEKLRENPHLAALAIEGALKNLKTRIRRNYKLAVPHWYNGRVQLLLPLCLTNDCTADLALVADRDKAQKCYTIQTILTMEMAYTDARLICRPDGEWLRV